MTLTARLALSQIKINRSRSVMTLLGIALSSAMLTAVCGFVSSAKQTVYMALGMDANAPLHFTLIAMGAVLGAIIVSASVIVVSNAFRVSAGERTRQFGILKSVGATKKQIASSVLYEGVFLSAVGIPIGIAVGLVIDLIGTSVLTNLLHSLYDGGVMNVDSEAFLTVPFVAPPLMFVIAVLTSFGTVLLSAWLPARRAAKIPAIDAIKSTGEVKLGKKSYRTSRLTQLLFGFEGTLAAKSLRRSRRSFRATVISLTISIVMLIAAGSLSALMRSTTNVMFQNIDATALADWQSDIAISYDSEGEVSSAAYITIDAETAEVITGKLRSYNNTEIFGIGDMGGYSVTLPDGTKTGGLLLMTDREHYEQLCRTAGVPIGSNILVNLRREVENGKRKEYTPYNFAELEDKSLTFAFVGREPVELTISGQLREGDIPAEMVYASGFSLAVLVPECDARSYEWYAKALDTAGFTEYAKQILADHAPQASDGLNVYAECMDISSITRQMRSLTNTIMFFVYGFVGMLTLIAVTSVISTISTNIRSRAREFATLESVGMTKSGVRKMLGLESILCSARSLIFGLPLGIAAAFALYRTMGFSVQLPFALPLPLIAECILGVFVVTWITMRYSQGRLKDGSIVETIRGE